MPRPSLKDSRSEEILDAYLTCITRFGLEGATQERIAQIAGVKRPLLRHYLGNRTEMLELLIDYVIERFQRTSEFIGAELEHLDTPQEFVDYLFRRDNGTDGRVLLGYQALTTSTEIMPEMKVKLAVSWADFISVVERQFERVAPEMSRGHRRAVAHGVAAMAATLDSMAPLSPPAAWHGELRYAALLLVSKNEGDRA